MKRIKRVLEHLGTNTSIESACHIYARDYDHDQCLKSLDIVRSLLKEYIDENEGYEINRGEV